jgi:hypothetical protein
MWSHAVLATKLTGGMQPLVRLRPDDGVRLLDTGEALPNDRDPRMVSAGAALETYRIGYGNPNSAPHVRGLDGCPKSGNLTDKQLLGLLRFQVGENRPDSVRVRMAVEFSVEI